MIQVLIKKSYDRTKRIRRRNWKLKELHRDREVMDTDDERYEKMSGKCVGELTKRAEFPFQTKVTSSLSHLNLHLPVMGTP